MLGFALNDLKETAAQFRVALYFAWSDTKARYKRSVLGPFWLVMATALGVVGLGVIWSTLLNVPREQFVPGFTGGLIVWQLVAGCIGEAPVTFVRNATLLRNLKLPYGFFAVHLLMRHLVNFAHNLIVLAVVLVIYPQTNAENIWQVIPGFALVCGNLLWMIMLIAIISARYRDLEPMVTSMLPILFFLSPVLYRPAQLGLHAQLMWFNPASYLVTLLRDPLTGTLIDVNVWVGAAGMMLAGWLLTLWLLGRKYDRIIFWV